MKSQVHDVCDFSGSQGGIKTVIRIPPDQQVIIHHWKFIKRNPYQTIVIMIVLLLTLQESQSLVDIVTHPLLAATSSVDRLTIKMIKKNPKLTV